VNADKNIISDYDNPRIVKIGDCNAHQGRVVYSPIKSFWITSMTLLGIIGGYYTASLEALTVFIITTGITICFGHSLGMHRRFIHNSFECPVLLEYFFVYLGVLVGLAGPLGMMHTHDLRDWAQRKKKSHAYFGHKAHFFKDAFWQMHCDLKMEQAPMFKPETIVLNNKFYYFLERSWMWQQLPIVLILFMMGGIAWVIWGVCLRVAVSVTGHWLIGHFAHNTGHRDWNVDGASVQGYNIQFCGLITMGECWHNNHHAFPDSALLGIKSDQTDPGWWMLLLMEKIGLVWNIKRPEDLKLRSELRQLIEMP
jgi:stearoyl-CoA desaturase (delta-9 desaturase)